MEGWKAEMEQEGTVGWGSKRRIQGPRGGKWELRKEKECKMGNQGREEKTRKGKLEGREGGGWSC